ncbi:MAG: hypothetical protein R8G66_31945 [Cytophagales bacterium]|nr:hypothetical protein [Cytophagales bacterium]
MKKLTIIITILVSSFTVFGQWDGPNAGNMYYNGGNVGIGTSSPSGSISSNQTGLHILDDNVSFLSLQSTAGVGKKYTLYSSAAGSLVFQDASSSVARGLIDVNGNWGIGVTDPSAKLSVDGFVKVQGADGRLMLENASANSSIYLKNSGTSTQRKFEIMYGPTSKFVMDNNGNVGIGTTSPSGSISSNQTGLHVMNDNVSYLSLESTAGVGKKYTLFSSAAGSLVFQDASSSEARGLIDVNGNWGIGVADPQAKLSVDGFVKVQGADGRMMLENASANSSIYLKNSGASSQRKFEILYGTTSKFVMDNNGNVGIGTTAPSGSISSNQTGLHVMNDNVSYLSLESTASVGKKYTLYSSASGSLVFQDASNAKTRGIIDIDGNWGIGVTNPDTKLVVDGTITSEEIILKDVDGADFVFEEDYDLRSLEETEKFIQANKHLPEIPSAAEMAEEGLEIKEMNILLLQKVEELTLHLIEQNKQNQSQQAEIEVLKAKIDQLEKK